jgi:hypothetical protein
MGGHRRGYSTLTHASTLGIGSCCAGSQGHATTPMPAASGLVPCKGFPTGEEPLDYSRYSPTTEVALPTETWHGLRAAFALSNRRRRLPPITLHVAPAPQGYFQTQRMVVARSKQGDEVHSVVVDMPQADSLEFASPHTWYRLPD